MKYLYNIGCSFSEGNGIAEDKGITESRLRKKIESETRYSAVMAKNLGLIEINEAMGGGSNQRTFRKTWEWISENSDKVNDTLFVIQWTYPLRSEFYYKAVDQIESLPDPQVEWWPVKFREVINKMTKEDVPLIHLKNVDTLIDLKYNIMGFIPSRRVVCKEMLRYMVSLQSFFKLNNIKHIFFEGENIPNLGIPRWLKLVDWDYFIKEDFVGFSGDNLTFNGHPNEQMQIVWAEKLIEFMYGKEWL